MPIGCVDDPAITGSAASPSRMGRFETEWLARPANLAALADQRGWWIDQLQRGDRRGSSRSTWIGMNFKRRGFGWTRFRQHPRRALKPSGTRSVNKTRSLQ
jgi:hypothetical protein